MLCASELQFYNGDSCDNTKKSTLILKGAVYNSVHLVQEGKSYELLLITVNFCASEKFFGKTLSSAMSKT